ncbi:MULTISPECIES: hypothetical protein [unclassified Chryseobacterium]|uniref:hypothetical protein n=1 Tax=unclassified Chryseobacterium TaxID=2593645 RepID=UPI0022699698|nr:MULTISPECIES: hypothetical protein [unclassified Chryseobacterium]
MYSYFITTWGITNFLLLAACIVGGIKYSSLIKEEKQYSLYIAFLFIIEAVTNVLTQFFHFEDTSFLYPIYIAGEFFLLTTLFIRKLNLSKIGVFVTSFITLAFLIAKYGFNFPQNGDIVKVVSNIVVICLSGFVLLQEIKGSHRKNRFLLVDACIFFYYAVSVFIFIIQNQIANLKEDDYYLLLGTNNILSSILYCSIIYTFLKLKK